ncbi:MAG TPA: HAMP domain-containing sensor histidine kinase [Polyangiales bacterium]
MNRELLPSIVPSLPSQPLPPRRVLLSLVLNGALMFAALMLFSLFATPFILALPQVDTLAMLPLTLAQVVMGVVMLAWFARKSVQRATPIYTTLLAGTRANPIVPPPPLNAVQAAFRLPENITYRTVACITLVPLLDVLGILNFSGLRGWARISVALLTVAVGAAGTLPAIALFRPVIWDWLGRLHPTDVPLPAEEKLARRMAYTVTLPVMLVGVSGVVALVSHLIALRARVIPQIEMGGMSTQLDFTAAGLALLMILVTASLAYTAAARAGGLLARDLRVMTERIDLVRRAQSPSDSAALDAVREMIQTPAGRKLATALSELARRFAEMSGKERKGRVAMEQVQRLRTQFLASMSHDLRSPLNSIVGFATLIESGAEGPVTPEQRESILMITRSARDLLRLVTNILDSARLEAGRLRVRRMWVSATDMLNQAVQEGKRLIGDRPLAIEAELLPNLPQIWVDQDRVVQALVGLFSHAIDAMTEGTIKLQARIANGPPGPSAPHLRIDVSDRGQGIREADQAALFQAFREMQEPSGRRIGGLGLGLSVARELVRAHGGDIWFESEAGRGTTFSVAIPLEGRDGSAPKPRPTPPPAP